MGVLSASGREYNGVKGDFMLISVAIITKNEERVIQRCLDCVSFFCDEIVVVDTGSTDKTKEIVARHPKARVFDSKNFNKDTHFSDFSFSVAKNEAIDKCTGDFVCWWDADDFVDEENAMKIRRVAEESSGNCLYSFTIKYGPLTFEHCRMFRNGIGVRFDESHSVHEYLDASGFPIVLRRDVEIHHVPGKKDVSSSERNLAIMEKDYYKRGMGDPRTCFYLGNSYRDCGRYLDAVKLYREYLEKSHWNEERYFARHFMAQCHISMEEYEEAKKEAFRACSEDLRFAEAYCVVGDLYFRDGDYSKAQHFYMLAAETPFPRDAKLFVTEACYGEYPRSRIMACQKRLTGDAKPYMNGKDEDRKISCLVEVVQVLGTFRMPDDVDEAIMALGVLSSVARDSGKIFEVDCGESEVVSKIVDMDDGLRELDGKKVAEILILPPNLKGRPREEWYGRAAGYVPQNWVPIVEEARKASENFRRALNVD